MANAGSFLEARVQRLFLAQGLFAERTLFPSADARHRLLATDIDVLASEYSSGFHLTRRHAECKSGRRVRVLDRILWLNGVRSMLGADASYLVLDSFEEDASNFAKSLNIDIMTIKQLETLESALNIPKGQWPNRSNTTIFEPIRRRCLEVHKEKGSVEHDQRIRQAVQFVEIDSWHGFSYARLNALLRILRELSDESDETASDEGKNIRARYAASALVVRLSQYLLAICHDISRVPVSDLRSYLRNRLTFGDQDPDRARGLIQNTATWMSEALQGRGMALPREIDVNRLFQPPSHSEGLVVLIQKLLAAPYDARYLPIAVETEQFGDPSEVEAFVRLRLAWNAGRGLAALVKGFAVASLGVKAGLLAPLWEDLGSQPPVEQTSKQGVPSSSSQITPKLQGN